MATSAMAAMPIITIDLYGKSTAFSSPNAAPVLCTCVRSRNSGITLRLSPSGSSWRTIAFVSLVERDDDGHRSKLQRVSLAGG